MAMYDKNFGPNRDCQLAFKDSFDGTQTKAENIFKEASLKGWRSDFPDYYMTWYVWQKLDDRYGPTWYPRWRWVQEQRWKDDTEKEKLTWEETVEDMSIAVGEDLFPFINKMGRKLEKDRFAKTTFMGKELSMPVAPIKITKPGNVVLDLIDDYKKPIVIKKMVLPS